ncbi:MAG: ChaN family lipoprotein, partial [Myxococcales bacterium]|nr:ChaN family lipoprotein [Myxococcales bacterium]
MTASPFRPRSLARVLLAATALAACHPTPSALAPPSATPSAVTAPPPSAAPSASPVADGGWQQPLLADHPLVGRIYRPGARVFTTRAELEAALARARYVLLGEKHDNRDHHRLQAELVTGLARVGRARAVAFEMIDVAAQPVVDELLARSATSPPDVDALAAALRWDASGWPAWSMYRPVFAAALGARARLVAANLSRTDAMAVARARREGKDPATA